jgi:hypothetical protein
MSVSPALTAMMCDGLGWFTEADYKRALLVYDEILYLLPETNREFRDVSGKPMSLVRAPRLTEAQEYQTRSYRPDAETLEMLVASARVDARDSRFASVVASIPSGDRLYTWRAVNADGDLAGADSPQFGEGEQADAHALLLNKFVLAAHKAHAIPITGKAYIHHLLGLKYHAALRALAREAPDLLPPALRRSDVAHHAAMQQIVGAFVSDADLQRRSYAEIVAFKREHRVLFERFSLLMRQTIDRIGSMPDTSEFREEVSNLVNTELWRERADVEAHLKSAWHDLFGSPAKSFMGSSTFRIGATAAASGLVLGILPCLQLGSLSFATLLAPGAVASTWMLERAFDYFRSHREAFDHGIYYLMRFSEE